MPCMAPEQIEGRDVDARSDIFSLGAVIHEMVTGQRAFKGETPASVIGAILKDEPRPMREFQPLSPVALDRIVTTCLAKDPEERWQSVADLARELKWTASEPHDRSAAPTGTAWRERSGWIAVTAALGIACARWTTLTPDHCRAPTARRSRSGRLTVSGSVSSTKPAR